MARAKFFVTEQIGPRRALTPEGFLVCYDVPIARTGSQKYGPGETPIEIGPEGFVLISRDADEVFRSETLLSFNGKPVTNDHPAEDVTPENWKSLAIGTVIDPRRGEDGMLIADLLITDANGIRLVNSGKVEVSCGYEADYEQTGPGTGRQFDIIGNHVALVDRARCGPRCSIGDTAAPNSKETPGMSKKTTIGDFLRRAFKAKDAAEVEAIEAEAKDSIGELSEPASAVHIHLGSNPGTVATGPSTVDEAAEGEDPKVKKVMDAMMKPVMDAMSEIKSSMDSMVERIAKLEEGEKGEKEMLDAMPEMTDDDMAGEMGVDDADVKMMKDSARFADSFRSVTAAAEIVAPGRTARTFDAAAAPKATVTALHNVRIEALTAAANGPSGQFIRDSLGGKPFDPKRISVRDARTLFNAVAAYQRQVNNASYRQVGVQDNGSAKPVKGIRTIADLNAANAARQWM